MFSLLNGGSKYLLHRDEIEIQEGHIMEAQNIMSGKWGVNNSPTFYVIWNYESLSSLSLGFSENAASLHDKYIDWGEGR